MRLLGIVGKMVGFSAQDLSSPGQIISPPLASPAYKRRYAHAGNVPFFHQRHINMCGDACLNMLLATKGKPHQVSFERNPRRVTEGLELEEIESCILKVGLVVPNIKMQKRKYTTEELASFVNRYGPIIVGGKKRKSMVGHYVLLIGVDEAGLVVHDPWSGPNKLWSLAAFNEFVSRQEYATMIAGIDPQDDVTSDVSRSVRSASADSAQKRLVEELKNA